MQDIEFFSRALGLKEPWRVKDVQMDIEAQKVTIEVECVCGTTWGTEEELLTVHGYEERRWRHLDTMQFETIIEARVPRVRHEDGHTEMVRVPWAEPQSRWTLMFEGFALRVLEHSRSVSRAAELLRLDWSSAQRIMERAVARGLERRRLDGVRHLGVDEKSFRRGQDYISVLVDLEAEAPRVLEAVAGRDTLAAVSLLETLPEPARASVEAVAMDLSAAYAAASRQVLPQADVVHDRFHISKLLGEAVDKVRRGEHQRLLARGDETLKGTRYVWLFHPGELDPERFDTLSDLLALTHLQTARAYYHRIRFMDFWSQPSLGKAQRFFNQWLEEARRSCLAPVTKVAQTLCNHLGGLLTYFRHRITNALSESFNSSIQSLKANARGFRNFEHYRIRILFFLGRLDLQPR
jgi:transposase